MAENPHRHYWLIAYPCRHGTYAEAILNQYNSFRSEPILNVSWTNLTRRFDQTSFILPSVVWIILILYNPFVDCLYFGLVQHSFISIHTHSFRFPFTWASAESRMPVGYLWACTMHAGIKDRDVANIAKMTDIT